VSGSRPNAASGLAEQHLGDRLSALVDGELGHDTRERVLAHVATCPKCKAEVDAQRRLKNVFAETAPPPPSESFLARLQGLPGGGDTDGGGGSPLGGGAFPGRLPGVSGRPGVSEVQRGEQFEFGYVPLGPHPAASRETHRPDGFRIHPVGRSDSERPASRGLRFAFVAAGAVSLAAVALGGVTTGAAGGTTAQARGGSGTGSNVTPAPAVGSGAVGSEATRRRQASGPLPVQRSTGMGVAVPTSLSAPLLPGVQPPAAPPARDAVHPPAAATPVLADAAVTSPLIRPLSARPPISLTAWSVTPAYTTPGLLAAPVQGAAQVTPSPATSSTAP
jgi:hypothetical protein